MAEKNPLLGMLSFAMSHPDLMRTAGNVLSLFSDKGGDGADSFLESLLQEDAPPAAIEVQAVPEEGADARLPILAQVEDTSESHPDLSQNRRAFLLALKPYLGKGRQARLEEILSFAPIVELFLSEGSGN